MIKGKKGGRKIGKGRRKGGREGKERTEGRKGERGRNRLTDIKNKLVVTNGEKAARRDKIGVHS